MSKILFRKILCRLILLWFVLLAGCMQPGPAESLTWLVPNSTATVTVAPSQAPTTTAVRTATATRIPMPTETQEQVTPRWVGPTPTAIQVAVTPGECAFSPKLSGQEFEVRKVGATTCVIWADEFNNETGFRVVLQFGYNGDMFVYDVPANRPGLPYPPILSAPLGQSFEYCMAHKDYTLDIYALLPGQESRFITGFSPALECNRFDMPSATPLPTTSSNVLFYKRLNLWPV